MRVIGAGFGRTGTLSFKRALEGLGLGPTYHMKEVMRRPVRWGTRAIPIVVAAAAAGLAVRRRTPPH
jgi:hypothetical protein